MKVLLAGDVFGNGRCDWYFEHLVLVGLHHQKNPQHESEKADYQADHTQNTPADHTAPHHATHEPEAKPDDEEATENDDGLSRVEFDERAFVNQHKNDTRYKAQDVTKKTSYVFLKAFGRRSCGSRSGSDGR